MSEVRISQAGRESRLWERDAGGALGEIQIALNHFLREHNTEKTLLVAALSGGPDSLAMTAALSRVALNPASPLPAVVFCVDHGWRSDSASEAAAAVACAREFGFSTASVLRADKPPATKSLEADARELRWRLLAAATKRAAAERQLSRAFILTAHTLDDQAETVLLGLARGASLRALCGMSALSKLNNTTGLPDADANEPLAIYSAKPLLGIRRATTHEACAQAGLEPAIDPSNCADGPWKTAAGEPLRRAALRDIGMPALAKSLGQDPAPALARFASQAGAAETALEAEAVQALLAAWPGKEAWHPGQSLKLSIGALAELPTAILSRVIRRAGEQAGWNRAEVATVHIHSVMSLVTDWQGQGTLHLPGLTVTRTAGYLDFSPC